MQLKEKRRYERNIELKQSVKKSKKQYSLAYQFILKEPTIT